MCLILLCVGVLATTSSVDVALDIAISCLLNIHFPHLLIQKLQLYTDYHCSQTKTEQTKIHFSGSHTHAHTYTQLVQETHGTVPWSYHRLYKGSQLVSCHVPFLFNPPFPFELEFWYNVN